MLCAGFYGKPGEEREWSARGSRYRSRVGERRWVVVGGWWHKHGENSGSAADIKHNFVLEEVLILHDGVHV
jgi:hypothetical protein